MRISIKASTARVLKKEFPEEFYSFKVKHGYEELPKDATLQITLDAVEPAILKKLADALKREGEKGYSTVAKLRASILDPINEPVRNLAHLPDALKTFLKSHANPYLHNTADISRGATYLPTKCEYEEAHHGRSANTSLTVAYIINGILRTRNFSFHQNAVGHKIPELLARLDLAVPDEDLTAENTKIMNRFYKFLSMNKTQFKAKGMASERDRSVWWDCTTINLTVNKKPTKVVLDLTDKADDEDAFIGSLDQKIDSDIYGNRYKVPVHPVLPVFSLKHHLDMWVNVCNMAPYTYDETLYEKLILPDTHKDLITALVSNLDLLSQDSNSSRSEILQSKSSSSVILASGPPGTGKTLTAEVYAEKIKRPLYEVQSGQLGCRAEEVEEKLAEVLSRASRLRMPLVINEADVFVQTRGRDLDQNAVVSVFLRALEYHDGLIFLTTNRVDDIDDAILSRTIAQIAYSVPDAKNRTRLWRQTVAEFGLTLSEKEFAIIHEVFPKVVGRDIQNLIMLTSRVCTANEMPFSLKALMANAVFKNIEVVNPKG